MLSWFEAPAGLKREKTEASGTPRLVSSCCGPFPKLSGVTSAPENALADEAKGAVLAVFAFSQKGLSFVAVCF